MYFTFIVMSLSLLISCGSVVAPLLDVEHSIIQAEERILFSKGNPGNYSQIAAMTPDGSSTKVIAHYRYDKNKSFQESYASARWSPDKSRIVIAGGPGSTLENVPLWLMHNSGQLLRQLTRDAFNYVWSRDGERIIFDRRSGYFSEIYDVYSVNIDGTGEKLLYQVGDSTLFHVSDISPSGKYILGYEAVFYTTEEGKLSQTDSEIVRIDLETREKFYLTDNDLNDGSARYNSDGTKIAYISLDNPGSVTIENISNIYIMSNDGSNKKKITNETKPNWIARIFAWSPDNNKIAYTKIERRRFALAVADIYVVDIETGITSKLSDTAKDGISTLVMDWK